MIEGWLASEPKLADPYVEDAWRLRQDGDPIAAQARLQQALDLEPQNVHALIEMGILFEQLEMPGRALTMYEKALLLDPRQGEVADRVTLLRARGVGKPLPD